jgi:hypothetical protein
MSNKVATINGQLFYASDMVQFNDYTEESQKYVAKIGQISDADVAKLEDLGIKVSHNDNVGNFINCKSKYVHKPVDDNDKEVDPKTIGNGSKCTAIISGYEWKFGKKTGVAPSAKKIIVTDLVTYDPNAVQAEQEEAEDVL